MCSASDFKFSTCVCPAGWLQIAAFFLPRRAVMHLHDHPGMTVFSKVLVGSAHVEAYDWVRPRVVSGQQGSSAAAAAVLAQKVLDHDVAASDDAWVLFPDTGGNLHRFVADDDGHCAFLDVLAPPYAPAEQRPCTYYEDLPYDEHDPNCKYSASSMHGSGDWCDELSCHLAFGYRQVL
jgi:cysteamine dioxygenase